MHLISTILFQIVFIHSTHPHPTHSIPQPSIRFDSQGQFKLVIFADLHYGEAPATSWGPIADLNSTHLTGLLLDWELPQFVVFTGDQLTAEAMFPNASAYVAMLVKPLVDRGFGWASTYGNHDIGPNVSRLEILEAEQSAGGSCYTTQMTNASIPGVTNYYLLIYSADGARPIMIWWFFDSQGGRNGAGQQPQFIDPAVIDWFNSTNEGLRKVWGLLPSLVFFHIPPQEFTQIQEGIGFDHRCGGLVDDDVTPQDNNTGIMQVLASAGGVQGVFVGHDHGNGWCCFYGEIQVCYGRHTGFGGYGTWTRGARIVNLEFKSGVVGVSSFVRLETGEVVDLFPRVELWN